MTILAPSATSPDELDVAEQFTRDRKASSRGATALQRWLPRIESLSAILLAVVAIALHARLLVNVGALWRDEANTVNVATVPHLSEMPRLLPFESFPLLHFGVLRTWISLFGGSDAGLRALGFITGTLIIMSMMLTSRTLRSRAPLICLALVGLNPIFIRYGDSARALGPGITLMLLTTASIWSAVFSGARLSHVRIALAAISAVCAVHYLYYNSVLLFAVACGVVCVAIQRRNWTAVAVVLGIGFVAALSLVIYVPTMRGVRPWSFLLYHPTDLAWLWTRASELMGTPHPVLVWLWSALVLGSIAIAGYAFVRRRLSQPALFAVVAMIVGISGYAAFLRILNLWTQPWYYVALAAFVACMMDVIVGNAGVVLRVARLFTAGALLCTTTAASWQQMPIRHTNVDFIAAELARLSGPDDIVVVSGWEYAISFSRYYKGPAEIMTLPPIQDHRVHRYDQVFEAYKTENAHLPLLEKMEATLRSGHHVFVIGEFLFPPSDVALPPLVPLRQNENGAWEGSGTRLWQAYAGQTLRTHGVHFAQLRLPLTGRISHYEDLRAGVVEGWQ